MIFYCIENIGSDGGSIRAAVSYMVFDCACRKRTQAR